MQPDFFTIFRVASPLDKKVFFNHVFRHIQATSPVLMEVHHHQPLAHHGGARPTVECQIVMTLTMRTMNSFDRAVFYGGSPVKVG